MGRLPRHPSSWWCVAFGDRLGISVGPRPAPRALSGRGERRLVAEELRQAHRAVRRASPRGQVARGSAARSPPNSAISRFRRILAVPRLGLWAVSSRDDPTVAYLVRRALQGLVGLTEARPTEYADVLLGKVDQMVARRNVDEVTELALDLAQALRDSIGELEHRGRRYL